MGLVTQSSSSRIVKILVSVLIVVVLLCALAEFGMRHVIRSDFREDVMQQAQEAGVENPEEPSIAFGASPVLFSLFTKKVPHITLDTPDTSHVSWPGGPSGPPDVKGQPGSSIVLDSVDISDSDAPTAEHVQITTTLSDSYLHAVLQQNTSTGSDNQDYGAAVLQSLIRITNVTSNAEDGTLSIEFSNGAATMTLKPHAQDGRLAFESTNSSLFGIDLSDQANSAIGEGLSKGLANSEQRGLRIEDARITEGGLQLTLSGENVNLRDINAAPTI